MLFSYADKFKHDYFIRGITNEIEQGKAQEKLGQVVSYGDFHGCRRRFLLRYFNENYQPKNCGNCDGCVSPSSLEMFKLDPKFKPKNTYSTVSDEAYDPVLFDTLRKIRTQEAARLKVPPYIIFGDKTLRELATRFPQTPSAFLNIGGVGNQKLNQFGELFMSAIRQYLSAVKTKSQEMTLIDLGSTFDQTKDLLLRQISVAEIAKLRGLSVGTIIKHIEKIAVIDKQLNLAYLRPDQERFKTILDVFKKTGSLALTPVREILGEGYTFNELRLARIFLNR
ncbi:MAG: HRDC domain-containing protein [Patescibacteria group bacterium]